MVDDPAVALLLPVTEEVTPTGRSVASIYSLMARLR
jgi:hypothetical protein